MHINADQFNDGLYKLLNMHWLTKQITLKMHAPIIHQELSLTTLEFQIQYFTLARKIGLVRIPARV
jgi:hypothetical protein